MGEEHGTVSLMFSNYCTSLEQSAHSRYKEKCRKCGFDPYALKPSDFDADLNGLPKVEYPDIVNYLVLQRSWLSKKTDESVQKFTGLQLLRIRLGE